MKRLPNGISNFETLINENYYYVDKTKYIEKLEMLDNHNIMFLRPRKFGKSLFTSVLENYYDVNKKDAFESLFKDTYIGKNPTNKKNSYYILRFDFSGIDTSNLENTIEHLKRKVISGIRNFITSYNFDYEMDLSGDSENLLNDILDYFKSLNLDNKMYVIIDEYDHFTNEVLSFNTGNFTSLVSQNGKVRKFYEVLKQGVFTAVDRVFITGVAPITMDSLTSGFNIADDITRDPRFNEMCGFTEEEVIQIMKNLELSKEKRDYLLPIMRKYYDGYKFSIKSNTHIYNSNMCLYFLSYYHEFGDLPETLIDKKVASDYSKIANIINICDDENKEDIILKSISGELIESKIKDEFNFELKFDLTDFISMLFYIGYLTIDSNGFLFTSLKVPNKVMKDLYADYFLNKVKDNLNIKIDYSKIGSEMAFNGKIDGAVEILERNLKSLSNRDYQRFDEKYVKVLFYSLVNNFEKIYNIKSEYETEGKYPDLLLFPNEKDYYTIMIEFKYLKKEEDGKLNDKMNEAKEQLINYSSSGEFKNIKLKRYAVVCIKSKVYVEEV